MTTLRTPGRGTCHRVRQEMMWMMSECCVNRVTTGQGVCHHQVDSPSPSTDLGQNQRLNHTICNNLKELTCITFDQQISIAHTFFIGFSNISKIGIIQCCPWFPSHRPPNLYTCTLIQKRIIEF